MLKKLLDHQQIVKSVFIHTFPTISAQQKTALSKVHLDHQSWDILHSLADVLEPFELATRSLCAKQYPTLSLVYTTINILRYGLKPKENDPPHLIIFKKSLLSQVELYFDLKMTKQQKELMLVCYKQYIGSRIDIRSILLME